MSDERSSEFQRILNQYALYVSRGQSENDFSGDDVMVLLDHIAALENVRNAARNLALAQRKGSGFWNAYDELIKALAVVEKDTP